MATPGTITIVHPFVSQLENSEEAAAAGEIQPKNWNEPHEVVGAAPIESPMFIGEPAAPTPPPGDNSQRLATMEALHAVAAPKRLTLKDAGDVTLPVDVALVVVKKTVPAAFTITLPSSLDLLSETVAVKDRTGANEWPVRVQTPGSETIDGQAYVMIDVDNMALNFRKIRNDAGDVTGEGYELV